MAEASKNKPPQIKYRSVASLTTLEGNPRKMNKKDFESLCDSIRSNRTFFEARPCILSDRTGKLIILAGNYRYKAAIQEGIKEIPTILLKGLTEDQEREIVIRDNVQNGVWDFEKLEAWDSKELSDWGVDLPKPSVIKKDSSSYEPRYEVVIECNDEEEQEKVYNEMTEKGHSCRVLTL